MPVGIVSKTVSVVNTDLVSAIILGQWEVHESNSKTDYGQTFEKYTSFNQLFTWYDVNLPDVVIIMKILGALRVVKITTLLDQTFQKIFLILWKEAITIYHWLK